MDTTKFLQHVLGSNGYYCVFAVRHTDKKLVQRFYENIAATLEAATQLDKAGFDTYFALGTMMAPVSREAVNVSQMRAFFLDLDCGPDKGFPSQQAAITALRQFSQTYQLPKPTVVNSGRGIHVYWPLTEPVTRDEWLPWARRFKRLCQMHKLPIDPVVPADAARVLRVPGTHNHKCENPRTVAVLGEPGKAVSLAEFGAILEYYAPRSELPDPRPDKLTTDPLTRALAGNTTNRFKTILDKCKQGKGCAQLTYIATQQAEISEPLWRGGLSVAVQCVDGEKAIHMISRGHPDYSPDATIQKAALTKGPYHCASFDEINPGRCHECPHWGKITSPIQLGREVMHATAEDNVVFDKPERIVSASLQQYVIPQYPAPYFRGKNGGIYLRTKNKDDEDVDVCVYHNDLYVVSRVIDPDTGDGIIVRLHMPYDGVREFPIPLTSVTSKEDLRKALSKSGVPVSNVSVLMDYLLKWVTKLEHTNAADAARLQFGWTDDDMQGGFALGRMLIHPNRIEPNAPSRTTAPRFSTFEQRGSLEGWKAAMEFYNRPGFEPWQYTMGCFFGSVLMRLLPINGTVFHLHSKGSGKGKTTALFAGASIWGSPTHYVLKEIDTQYSRMMRAEVWKDLPVAIDEMTNISASDASEFLYQMPAGMQRNRMAATGNAERYRGDPWKLICVTTGNTSLIERVSRYKDLPKAEMQRVLEYRVFRKQFRSKEETDIFSASLVSNYGHAGIQYLQYVMTHLDKVRESLFQIQREIDVRAGLTAENRFWSAQTACAIMGLTLAKKLGLINYDVKAVLTWVVDDLLAANKAGAQGVKESATDLITEYLAAHYNGFLRLRSTDDLRGRPTGLDHLVIPTALPKGALYGRHEEDTNILYLLPKPLRQWCSDRQIDYNGLIHDLKRGSTEAKFVKVRLTKGTKVSMPPVNALMLRGEGWMTDETQQDLAGQTEEDE